MIGVYMSAFLVTDADYTHFRLVPRYPVAVAQHIVIRVKLGRSRSSPTPPAGGTAALNGRAGRAIRRRAPPLLTAQKTQPKAVDWSTSYHGGSSGSQSGESSSTDSDDGLQHSRQRSQATSATINNVANGLASPRLLTQVDPEHSSRSSSPSLAHPDAAGRRSRSPVVKPLSAQPQRLRRTLSPNTQARNRQHTHHSSQSCLLPSTFCITLPFPWGRRSVKASGDVRKAGENIILLLSLLYGIEKTRDLSGDGDNWIAIELSGVILLSIIYLIWTHLSYFSLPEPLPVRRSSSHSRHRYRSVSPQVNKKTTSIFNAFPIRKDDFGYVWMTVPKNYRDSTDDGVLTALLMGPLISTACLYTTGHKLHTSPPEGNPLPPSWIIETPMILPRTNAWSVIDSLYHSRQALVQISSLTSSLLLVHLFASRVYEGYHRSRKTVPESERASVPRSAWLRSRMYVAFSTTASFAALAVKHAFVFSNIGIWRDLSYFDVLAVAAFYQLVLYMAIRLAHHSFTLGELGLASFGAVIMFTESLRMTLAKIWPGTTLYLVTFRHPTPLLILQLALIPGSILVGVLLSPILYLSRRIAQRPLRRLRFPEEKQIHRRFLALGFYLGAVVITGGLIGMWTRWCLGGRDPWVWAIRWILQGKKKWTRPLLLAYWVVLVCVSVAAWVRRLFRSRKYRHTVALQPVAGRSTETSINSVQPTTTLNGSSSLPGASSSHPDSAAAINENVGPTYGGPHNLVPILPSGTNVSVSGVATDLLDAADKRVPSMGLNARRKFFHALAVIMFVPGIAIDPAFTHLSFSVGFAIFTFAEYLRYFALYPFGAAIHVFLTEFIDDKDSGTAIMSHFYLLTGCASSIWLEDDSKLLGFTGVLIIGVGDAMASVIGRRIGRTRWSTSSPKTVEGSAAFVIFVVACAWVLRLFGLVEPFNTMQYTAITAIAAVLEALSVQNDNLTLPWYTWSMQILMGVC